MTNQLSKDMTRSISALISSENIEKYGWMALFAPITIYVVDKISGLVSTAIEKDYSLNVKTEKIQISLNKSNTITD